MYLAPIEQNIVIMFCVVKRNQPDQPRFVTDYYLRNFAIYKKQTLLPNIDKRIELVTTYPVWSKIYLVDRYFNNREEESSEK